jgi:hypothetical protein
MPAVPNRTPLDIEMKIFDLYNASLDIPIQSVLTDNGLEFTTHHQSKNHSFERLLQELKINHRLNDDLNQFMEFYNCQRTHQGKRTQGKVPAELYLLTKTQAV